ncbi:hypothetical protein DLM76_20420 [Leptospira yasudae]|uniref:hypothetical protein n=1 Tax=Leptospira yasudae TaxID=2202201 RepID=UPI000E59B488|nr:hypothetical protein [Leptospira yasudae]RHX90231.1 hypothetical protein DLM76_20420 [Leptospira yasudae]
MKTIYLDNNVYDAVLREEVNAKKLWADLLSLSNGGNARVLYSLANISEAPKDGKVIALMRTLCKNNYLNEKYQIVERDPQELHRTLHENSLESDKLIMTESLSIAAPPFDLRPYLNTLGFGPQRLNNISEEEIFPVLTDLFDKLLSNGTANVAGGPYANFDMDKFVKERQAQSIDLIEKQEKSTVAELIKIKDDLISSTEQYSKLFDLDIALSREIIAPKLAEIDSQLNVFRMQVADTKRKLKEQKKSDGVQIKNFKDFLEFLYYAVDPPITTLFGKIQLHFSLLDSFGYYPDTKKKKRKERDGGYWVEIWDTNHLLFALNCDYFITKDFGFYSRANAIIKYHNLNLRILSIEQCEKEWFD